MKKKLLRKIGAGLLGLGVLLGAYGALPEKKAAAEEKQPINFTVTQEQDEDMVRVFLKNESDKVFKVGKVKVTQNKRLSFFSNEEVTVAPGDKMPIHVRVKVKVPAEPTKAPEAEKKPEESKKAEENGLVKTGQKGLMPAVAVLLMASGGALIFVTSGQKNKKRMMGLLLIAAVSIPAGLKVLNAEDYVNYAFKEVITLEGVSEEVLFTVSFYPVEPGQHDEKYDVSSVTRSEEVPYKTVYVAAEAYDGEQTVTQKGKDPIRQTTTYKDDQYPAEERYSGGQDEIIAVGNLKKTEKMTPYKTLYEADRDQLYGSEDLVKQAGAEGRELKVYAFPVNPDTGEVNYEAEGSLVHEESTDPQDEIIVRAVGAEEKTEIPYKTVKKDDLAKPKDYEKVTQKGEKGYDLTRGYYAMDKNGKVEASSMAGVLSSEHKDAVDEIITRGVEWRETKETEAIPFETETEYFITKEKAESWTSADDLLQAINDFDDIASEYNDYDEDSSYLDAEGNYYMYMKQRGADGERTITHAAAYNKEGKKVEEKEPASAITKPVQNAVIVHRGFKTYSNDVPKVSTNRRYVADAELAFEEQSQEVVEYDYFYEIPFAFDNGETVKYLLYSQGRTDIHVGNKKQKGEAETLPFEVEVIDYVYFDDEFDPALAYEGLVYSDEDESGTAYDYIIKKKGLEGSETTYAIYDVDPADGTLSYREDLAETTEPQTEERYRISPSEKTYYINHNIEKQIRGLQQGWAAEAIGYINAYRAENGLSVMLPDPASAEGAERCELGCIVARRQSVSLPAEEIGSVDVDRYYRPSWNVETRSPAELFFEDMKAQYNDWLLTPDAQFGNAYIGAASKAGGRTHEDHVYWIAAIARFSNMNVVDHARYQMEGRTLPQ